MPNAIAFNSIQFNLARVIGPLLAGAALAAFGMVACFGLNGLSFLAVIAAILSLHIRHTPPATTTPHASGAQERLRVRARASGAHRPRRARLRHDVPRQPAAHVPAALRAERLSAAASTQYTHLMAFAGAGAVTGALVVAWLGKFTHMGRTLLILQVVFGVLVVLFALTRIFWINAVLLFGGGACMVMVFAMLSSLVQLNAPNEMRGRVMSIYMVAFRGGMPLGSLAGGWAGDARPARPPC